MRFLSSFPPNKAGGCAYLKSLFVAIAGMLFCPTGGITRTMRVTICPLPNVVCVGGSWFCTQCIG